MNRRVCWSSYVFRHGLNTGVARVGERLLTCLNDLGQKIELVGDHIPENLRTHPCQPLPGGIPFIGDAKIFWCQRLSWWCNSQDEMIFHGLSNFDIPLNFNPKIKTVVTIHDIIPLIDPRLVSKSLGWQISYLTSRVVNRADAIISVSEWTRSCLEERFPHVRDKIRVIRNGLGFDKTLTRKGPLSKQKNKLLAVSRWEPYKRNDIVFRAVKHLKNKDFQLDFVTNKFEIATATARELGIEDQVRIHTNISDEKLTSLYSEASVFVHPSQYEGFCLPVAEALHYNLPVVYTQGSALDELVPSECGVAMGREDGYENLIDAIEKASQLAETDSFYSAIEQFHQTQKSWQDSAVELNSLYNQL